MKRKQQYVVMVGLVMMSFMICGGSGALELPDGLIHQADISQQAFALAQAQFATLIQELKNALPNLPADYKAIVEKAIPIIEERKDKLQSIDVYFADENTPGDAYDSIYAYFQGKLQGFNDVEQDKILDALNVVPPNLIPDTALTTFNDIVNSGYDVKGAGGMVGKAKVSFLTIYLHPQTFEVLKGTTVVVATEQ